MARFLVDTTSGEVFLITDVLRGETRRLERETDKEDVEALEKFLRGWDLPAGEFPEAG